MTRLVYSREELLADHTYVRRQEEVGYLLHGGFDAEGVYLSPKTLYRWPAIHAWQGRLQEKGWPLVDATVQLLKRASYPAVKQQKLLLQHGIEQPLWNALTVTGIVEARGRILCTLEAPDFQEIVVEDLAETAVGHLRKGLLYAHGADEGGDPAQPRYGAHDAMWFAARDHLFGKGRYPENMEPDNIGRPPQGRLMEALPEAFEEFILLLMNVLMIEVRAEAFFSHCQEIMRDPEIFQDRREQAQKAALMIERIRTDEAVHVAYLQTVVSELRSLTFTTGKADRIAGKQVIDPVWDGMVRWHGQTQADMAKELAYKACKEKIMASSGGQSLLEQFNALDEEGAPEAA